MKGPLDALIDSEALQATPFDDPMSASQLGPIGPKKFNYRRFFRNLFRRIKSKTVRVKAADPRQVKLVLFAWGTGITILVGTSIAFWAFLPGTPTELWQRARDAVAAEDYAQAVRLYDDFLSRYPNAPNVSDVRLARCCAKTWLADKEAAASGDWTPALEVAQEQAKALPKEGGDADMLRKFGVAVGKIGEGLARQAQDHPDAASVDRLRSIVHVLDTDVPQLAQPAKMIEEIGGILRHVRRQVEGGQGA